MKLLERVTQHSGTALILEDTKVSYSELNALIASEERNVQAGEVCALVMRNNLKSIVSYLACLKTGAPVILLNDYNQLQNIQDSLSPDRVFDGSIWKELSSSIKSQPHPDLRLLLSTSGSTGSPKMVKLSGQNLDANADSICDYLSISSSDRTITSLPLTYSFGLSLLHSYLWAGASLVVTEAAITERKFWQAMKAYNVTSFSGVPFHYETLLKLRFISMDLPHLKVLTQAGGKLNNSLLEQFAQYAEETDRRFFVMYGQTEAAPRIAYLPPENLIDKIGSIGRSIPGGHLYLIDDDGSLIEDDNVEGELVYEGQNVMMGYASSRHELESVPDYKPLKTGDLAYKDNDGFFFIQGRKKRYIKMQGRRFGLEHLEHLLHVISVTAICIGQEDCLRVFTVNENMKEKAKELLLSMSIHPMYFKIIVLDSIPHKTNGKVDYQVLNGYLK